MRPPQLSVPLALRNGPDARHGVGLVPGSGVRQRLADVLLGAAEPGGQLPVSWLATEEGLPSTQPMDREVSYDERPFRGLSVTDQAGGCPFIGSRPWLQRLGHLSATAKSVPDGSVTLDVQAQHGGVAGRHVNSGVRRPTGQHHRPAVRWLAGSSPSMPNSASR